MSDDEPTPRVLRARCPACRSRLRAVQEGSTWVAYCGLFNCESVESNEGKRGPTVEAAVAALQRTVEEELENTDWDSILE